MPQTKTQKAVVRRWVKYLESGQYKQGKGQLVEAGKTFDRFCCLGVLCDMAVRAKVIAPPIIMEEGEHYLYSRKTSFLPTSVMEWAGLSANNGEYSDDSLAGLNDNGKKFKTIAKIIKSNPAGLFVD